MTPAGGRYYAGFWRRLAASCIDTLFLSVLLAILYRLFGFNTPSTLSMGHLPSHASALLLNFLLPAVITTFFWMKFLGTPGKLLLGCEVVDAHSGAPLSARQAALRYLGYFVSLLPLGLGFLWVAWDRGKQGFHDKIAKTVVVLEDPLRQPLPDVAKEFR